MTPNEQATRTDPSQIIAELKRERDDALAREAAIAEVLQVINSSPGDLAPVFDAMLDRATSLCEAAFGVLWIIDGERIRAVATHNVPSSYRDFLDREAASSPGPSSGVAQTIRAKSPLLFADAAAGDAYQSGDPFAVAAVELGGVRTLLNAPLVKEDAVLGILAVYRKEVRPFSEKQIALLQNFAAQAVIAMENARLLTETREALDQQTATAEVLQVINSSPGDLLPVFDAILDKAHSLCGAYLGSLFTYDGERFWPVAGQRPPAQFSELMREGFRPGPGNPFSRVLEGEPLVHIADIRPLAAQHPDDAGLRVAVEVGLRTFMAVPLHKDNVLLGVITANRREVRPFTEKQIALLQNFAAQAVIAMENARLITETREALEQQTATAEVLGVINSSPGDLAPVFDVLLEKATQVCDAAFGVMNTYDGERFHTAAVHRLPPALAETYWHDPAPPGPHSPLTLIAQGKDVVSIDDLTVGPGADLPRRRILIEQGGARSWVAVALRKDDTLLGAISAYRTEVRPFSDKQIALLQNFAAQAVIAIENARLLGELRQRTEDLEEALEQQTATAEVLGVINSSPGNLAPVFDAILEKLHTLCGAPLGALLTFDGESFGFLARKVPADLAEITSRPFKPGPQNRLTDLIRGEPLLHIPDAREVLALAPEDPQLHATVEVAGMRTFLAVPLRKDDRLVGAITAARQEVRPFTEKQIALLRDFAAQAVIAMENARLLTETREALEQQTATAEVLQVINSSPGDLEPVFEAILQKAHDLCGTGHGALFMRDGERFKPVAFHDAPEPIGNYLRQYGLGPDAPAVGPLLDGARFVHIPDMRDIDHPGARAAVANGVRTLLSVPLRKDGLVGTINAVRFEVRPFVDKEISLLENFADQAVIAIENARLLRELRQRTDEVAELNRDLETRVAEQVDELGRVGRLKRFLAPQLAELIVSQGDEKILESHRREIVVVFCDLRGYTAFTETAEPEEVLDFLRQYHGALGPLVSQFEGTLDQFSGDGIMVFFNDPVPCPNPAERAVKMAMAMRDSSRELIAAWRRHGCELGFGAGIAQGFATLGQIGFSERSGYTAIGTVCNLAARLCAEAKDGQILVSSRIAEAVEAVARLEDLGNLELKGLRRPVAAFNVVQSTSSAEARPNLTVVAKGPGV